MKLLPILAAVLFATPSYAHSGQSGIRQAAGDGYNVGYASALCTLVKDGVLPIGAVAIYSQKNLQISSPRAKDAALNLCASILRGDFDRPNPIY